MVETVTCHRVPDPLAFQRATLKSWEWPGDKANHVYVYIILHMYIPLGRAVWQVGSLSHAINAEATGYLPLPDFPEEAPDPSVRNVEDTNAFWAHRPGSGSSKKTTEEGSDFYSSISGSEESGSESGSETGWWWCVYVCMCVCV